MKDWLKYTLFIVTGFVLLIIVTPLMFNWFILKERQFAIVGEATDWLQFWPVYLGAIGTIAMTIATFCTLKANQRQMASMIASEGAQLVFSLTSNYEYVFLKVTNVGRSVARNIQLSIPNRLDIIERNAGMPFGEGLIKHFNKLTPIPLLLPNQSDYIPLYMYRALGDSIKDKDGVKTVELFGDSYMPENITLLGEYFQNETFTITGSFTNYLNQQHPVSQEVDNTYIVSLADENKSIERALRELNKNLVAIKNELHSSEVSKLKDLPASLDKVKSELHTMADTLKKIEQKLKK
jgi:hypothetical protein